MRDLFTGALVDLFAGGGGASGALHAAHGRPVRMILNLARPAADPDAPDTSTWPVPHTHDLAPEADAIAAAVAETPRRDDRIERIRRYLARGAHPVVVRDELGWWPDTGHQSSDTRRWNRDLAAAMRATSARRAA